MSQTSFQFEEHQGVRVLRLESDDGTNRLTQTCVVSLTETLHGLRREARVLVVTGNSRFFSVGANLAKIAALNGPAAYEFSRLGQSLMAAIESFPAQVYAAISGYCMGGGLDLALSCHQRIASPNAIFGHRGAALGLITGWGGTQRLPRLIGQARTLEMFVAAEKVGAAQALRMGLIDRIAEDPIAETCRWIRDIR
ncbi:MAG TPA: enoyl-CoA hydratase/isomerase family protein [Candidatus Sulfotelmatobacter sp.]|nr:enoyl-CoA hydratase/isomerase family protein [Candidatus Sulfotelmatobacter sp.]